MGKLEHQGPDDLYRTDLFHAAHGRSVLLPRDGLRRRTPRDGVDGEAFAQDDLVDLGLEPGNARCEVHAALQGHVELQQLRWLPSEQGPFIIVDQYSGHDSIPAQGSWALLLSLEADACHGFERREVLGRHHHRTIWNDTQAQ